MRHIVKKHQIERLVRSRENNIRTTASNRNNNNASKMRRERQQQKKKEKESRITCERSICAASGEAVKPGPCARLTEKKQ